MLDGITVLRNDSTRARAAADTSTAFSPGFLVTVSVTAGNTCPAAIAAAVGVPAATLAAPGVNHTYRCGNWAPASIFATSRR